MPRFAIVMMAMRTVPASARERRQGETPGWASARSNRDGRQRRHPDEHRGDDDDPAVDQCQNVTHC